LAKNLFLTPERTLLRKIRELMLALWLEARLSKDDILTLYMNRVYLGAGAYGVEAASQRYFGKSARKVNLPEAALLAGLLKAPSRYAPTNDIKRSRDRAAQVLRNMVAAGFLTEKEATAAKKNPFSKGAAGSGARAFRDLETTWQGAKRGAGRVGRPRSERRDPRHGRRSFLCAEPVQPGGSGAPPAGLRFQAICLSGGA
jgi:penicillin-binding protein 1A